jgi:UDP-GlcNAc:undecaprenyl-phosphate/decaprenyl-phosphate GlcNAc-1-phosphate transferase
MLQTLSNSLLAFATSIVVSVILTFLVRKAAVKFGFVAAPKKDRWHKRSTAMMGGVAIYLATVLMFFLFVDLTREALVILVGSSFLFFVGLLDDYVHIKPYQKLIGQFIGVSVVVGFGLVLPWTGSDLVNIAITAFWLIGITNAINLLDNMDGLAAGISAIAAFILALGFAASGQPNEVILVTIFVGALLGFLTFNFNPASIFMGDSGSMFVGFFLASCVLLNQVGGRSRSVMSVLAVPALILFVPIFDTTFVTILRKLWGRKASQGGRDHTSHRLVALGLSERSAVLMLYGFALLAGILSLFVRELEAIQSLVLIGLFTLALTIIGVYLAKVKVYKEQEAELAMQEKAMFGFLVNLSHKRRVFEVILDACLISLSYYGAYFLIFGPFENTETWSLFIKTLPILIVIKLFTFLAVGVYRGIWRYTSLSDFVTFTKGVVISSVVSVLIILAVYRFQGFSRTVFFVDALLILFSLSISRLAFRFFRKVLPNPSQGNKRNVLIYGAGDGGEMILRELENNPEWNYNAVGFVDDDPLKKDKLIHGLKVFGGNGSLKSICIDNEVEEILLSFRKVEPERLKEVREICEESEVSLKRALIKIEPIDRVLGE